MKPNKSIGSCYSMKEKLIELINQVDDARSILSIYAYVKGLIEAEEKQRGNDNE